MRCTRRVLFIPAIAGLLIVWVSSSGGQSVRSLIREGNELYGEEKFPDAEVQYRKALEMEKEVVQGHFNLGNSLYRQKKYDESVKQFDEAAARAESGETKAFAYYNKGNSFVSEQKYEDAVKSYIEALKLNPEDAEAKYNLSYALEKLRQQQQQPQKNNNQNQDKNKNSQDTQKQNQQNQDQQKNQQDQQNQKNQQNQDQQQSARQEKQMSRADAERILEVLKNNEKELQKKLRIHQGARAKTDRDW
jgi:Ca-activated chloride channel family protein